MKNISEIKLCTACFACMDKCPKGAIRQGLNIIGEEIPIINHQTCISCGMCVDVCPANKIPELHRSEYCFAAWSNNSYDLERSSSGGIAAVLSRYIIEEGGIVYGAISRGARVFHERIDSLEEIEYLRGSKYVKSDTRNCYAKVRRDLINGKQVLFIGTPCQVAGLKNCIGKEYQNLVTIDLVCHGTPPFSYLKEHLESCVCQWLHPRTWDTISFRYNNSYFMRVFNNGKIVYQKKGASDLYFSAFLDSLILRRNCYRCQYARSERVGDLTIGDFWGIDRTKLDTSYKGKISVVLPNTQKGLSLLMSNESGLTLFRLPLEDALNHQQENLLHPSIPNKDREAFEELFPKYGFEGAIRRTNYGKRIIKVEREKIIKNSAVYKIPKRLYHFVKKLFKQMKLKNF